MTDSIVGTLDRSKEYLRSEDQEFAKKEKLTVEYLDYNWKSNDLKNAN